MIKLPYIIRRPDLDTVKHFKAFMWYFWTPVILVTVAHYMGF